MLTMSSGPFMCVNCGRGRADSLFKSYGVKGEPVNRSACHLRLTECEECGRPVDEYVELESSILLIDAVLLKSRFPRHLCNSSICGKSCVKLALLLLVADSVFRWSRTRSPHLSYVRLEYLFYVTFAEVLCHNIILYSLIVAAFTATVGRAAPTGKLVKMLIFCSFAKLMHLLPVLWPCDWETGIQVVVQAVLVVSLSQSLATLSSDDTGKERLSFRSAAAVVLIAKVILLVALLLRPDAPAHLSIQSLIDLVI